MLLIFTLRPHVGLRPIGYNLLGTHIITFWHRWYGAVLGTQRCTCDMVKGKLRANCSLSPRRLEDVAAVLRQPSLLTRNIPQAHVYVIELRRSGGTNL